MCVVCAPKVSGSKSGRCAIVGFSYGIWSIRQNHYMSRAVRLVGGKLPLWEQSDDYPRSCQTIGGSRHCDSAHIVGYAASGETWPGQFARTG